MSLRDLLTYLASPFIFIGSLPSILATPLPDMRCIGYGECKLNDCANCSLYEPRAAYPLEVWGD